MEKQNSRISEISPYYSKHDIRMCLYVFRPTVSDAHAFVLNNQYRDNNYDNVMKAVEFTFITDCT